MGEVPKEPRMVMLRGKLKHREAIFLKVGDTFVAKVYGHDGQPVEQNARRIVDAWHTAPAMRAALEEIGRGPCVAREGNCGECWACIARAALEAQP